jgi:hypothetical protein
MKYPEVREFLQDIYIIEDNIKLILVNVWYRIVG